MTDLTQQLKEKKKELIILKQGCHNYDGCDEMDLRCWEDNLCIDCGNKVIVCQAEIAILEQAIAEINSLQAELKACDGFLQTQIYNNSVLIDEHKLEMQKQRQDFKRILNRIIGKLEDGRNQREEITDYCKNKKQQLNQPKTEE